MEHRAGCAGPEFPRDRGSGGSWISAHLRAARVAASRHLQGRRSRARGLPMRRLAKALRTARCNWLTIGWGRGFPGRTAQPALSVIARSAIGGHSGVGRGFSASQRFLHSSELLWPGFEPGRLARYPEAPSPKACCCQSSFLDAARDLPEHCLSRPHR